LLFDVFAAEFWVCSNRENQGRTSGSMRENQGNSSNNKGQLKWVPSGFIKRGFFEIRRNSLMNFPSTPPSGIFQQAAVDYQRPEGRFTSKYQQ